MAGKCFFVQKVWDGSEFVEYSNTEITYAENCEYFILNPDEISFFSTSGMPINRIFYDNYLDYDGYPLLTEIHYLGRVITPEKYTLSSSDSEIIAYYGATPGEPDNPGSDTPDGGYTLKITYRHNLSLEPYDTQSIKHYGAWLSDDATMATVYYYDKDGNKKSINRMNGLGNVYNWILSHSTLKGYSESNPCRNNAEVQYVVSTAARLKVLVGNEGGTVEPNLTSFTSLNVNIGDSYIITAIPYVGYAVDHWAIYDYTTLAWIDLYYPEITYTLLVTEPGYDYLLKVYFKETTLDNKMATKNDLNYLIPSVTFFTSNLSNCPTASTIKNSSVSTANYLYKLRVNGTYANNLLVKLKDCSWSLESLEYTIYVLGTYINASGSGYYAGQWFPDGSYYSQYVQATVKFYASSGLVATEYTQIKIQASNYASLQYSLTWAHLTPITRTFNKSTKINRIEIQLSNGYGFLSGNIKLLSEYELGRDYTWTVLGLVVG